MENNYIDDLKAFGRALHNALRERAVRKKLEKAAREYAKTEVALRYDAAHSMGFSGAAAKLAVEYIGRMQLLRSRKAAEEAELAADKENCSFLNDPYWENDDE